MSAISDTETIMIVDDIVANRIALSEMLREPGRRLVEAASGVEALRLLRKEAVDLILLDVEMPQMDGFETAALIRGSSRLADVPIIFQTAHGTDERAIQGYDLGAVDFITKPIVPRVLRARMGVFLELKRRASEMSTQAAELRRAYERLSASEARTRAILETATDGIITVDCSGVLELANAAAHRMFGYTAEEMDGIDTAGLLSRIGSSAAVFDCATTASLVGSTTEVIGHRKDGSVFPAGMSVAEVAAVGRQIFSATLRDLTESKQMEAKLRHMAQYDHLTGLPNRFTLTDRLELFLKQSRRYPDTGALFFIDLDGFKTVNDTWGHRIGDLLLVEVARRLRASFRETDIVARLGGDEFCVLADRMADDSHVSLMSERVVGVLGEPYEFDGVEIRISASVGVAAPSEADTVDTIMARADEAMYGAKRVGGHRAEIAECPVPKAGARG